MQVVLVIATLGAGGAERVLVTLANYWAAQGWQVTILTMGDGATPSFFALNGRVQHRALALAHPSHYLLGGLVRNSLRVWALRRAIVACQPALIISFMPQTNVVALLAAVGLRLPVIITEHTDPYHAYLPGHWRLLRWLSYPLASRLVVLNATALGYFSPRVRRRTRIIPNPVVIPEDDGPSSQSTPHSGPLLLAMGRLVEVKGFDRLLRAWAQIAHHHLDWSLEIWGEGPLRPALEALCQQLALGARVRLPGLTRKPFSTMRRAELLVVTSHYEGFSLVLAEAMACGLPVVSFDCPSGPRELIRDGINGLLVPNDDIAALARTLDRLMGDGVARERLAARAPDVLAHCGLVPIMLKWEALIGEICCSRSGSYDEV